MTIVPLWAFCVSLGGSRAFYCQHCLSGPGHSFIVGIVCAGVTIAPFIVSGLVTIKPLIVSDVRLSLDQNRTSHCGHLARETL